MFLNTTKQNHPIILVENSLDTLNGSGVTVDETNVTRPQSIGLTALRDRIGLNR